MHLHIDRFKTVHFRTKGKLTDTVVGDQVEPVTIQFEDSTGTIAALSGSPTFLLVLKAAKDDEDVLSSTTTFSVSGTTYTGELDLRNDAVRALTDGQRVHLELQWTIATKQQRTDPCRISIATAVITGDEGVPTDGNAAAIAEFLGTYLAAGSNVTISVNTTTGIATISAAAGEGGDFSFALTADGAALKVMNAVGNTTHGYSALVDSWPGEA